MGLGKKGLRLNKKGMLDDFFDFLFTVMAAFFILMFVQVSLGSGAEAREELSLEGIEVVGANRVLLNYLERPVEEGRIADLILLGEGGGVGRERLVKATEEIILASSEEVLRGISVKYPGEERYLVVSPKGGIYSIYAKAEIKGKKGIIEVNLYGPEKLSEERERWRAATGFRAG